MRRIETRRYVLFLFLSLSLLFPPSNRWENAYSVRDQWKSINRKANSMIGDVHTCEIWANNRTNFHRCKFLLFLSPLSLPRSLSLFTKKQSPNLIDHMKWMTYVSRVGSLIKKNQMACACPSSRKKAQIWWDDTLLFIRLFWIYLNGKIVAHVGFDQKEREDKC